MSAPFENLIYAVDEYVCTITLNRPEKRNALSAQLVNELIYALELAGEDDEVRAIVLTGAGKAFCSGGDLSQMSGGGAGGESQIPWRGGFAELNLAFTTVCKPVIAKVRGYAYGGGLGLLCACQFAFAEAEAKVGTPEIHRGLFPMMIMANIFRNVPRRKGLEFILMGERIMAEEAAELGIITRAIPGDELDEYVHNFAQTLVDRPPQIVKLGLEAFYKQADMDFADALPYLNEMLMKCLGTSDAQKGLMAFLSKQKPDWRS